MRILLLGGTGRTGKHALTQALAGGHEVTCLARNTERIKPEKGLTLFEGNPANKTALEKAMAGCDAIISVLNISRTSDFPWAKLRTPENYLSEVMEALIPIAEENNIRRLIVCSAWGVGETEKDIPGWFKWFINNSNIRVAYEDHARQENLITGSRLNWTVVRPVGLTNSNKPENIVESFAHSPKPGLFISRKSVAAYLVQCLDKDELINKKVVISKK